MNTIATLFGDVIPTKICSKCKEEKPLSKFSSRTRDRNGNPTELRNDCQDCQSARGKEVSSLKKLHTQPKNDTYHYVIELRKIYHILSGRIHSF